MDFQEPPRYHKKIVVIIILWIIVSLMIISACRLVMESDQIFKTMVAVKVQQTQLAGTSSDFSTLDSYSLLTITPSTIQPVAEPQLTASQIPSTQSSGSPEKQEAVPDLDRRKKAAKILLFENMSASGSVRYVKEALDQGGFFYLDVGSATGWFRNQLLSPVKWDLIIAAAEARRGFGGEFFELINQHLETGESAIIEYWNLDLAPDGKVESLLAQCGIEFQFDWFEPEMRVLFWLVPDHPIFHEPNEIPMLTNALRMWEGDIGDLLAIRYHFGQPQGDAILLAGTNPGWKEDHGTLVSCLDNRLVLQTFPSHEYSNYDVIRLWQNYIHFTLKSRFSGLPSTVPTPMSEMQPMITENPIQTDSTQTELEKEFGCGGILSGQLSEAVHFQSQLFEHNATGEFLIIDVKLENLSQNPIQVWDGDYTVEGLVNGDLVRYPIQKAATGYLYIENPKNLWQDLIEKNVPWETSLAFDIDPSGKKWVLVIAPGSEFNEQICELRITLTR